MLTIYLFMNSYVYWQEPKLGWCWNCEKVIKYVGCS